jgi:hypothetical protein
MDLIESSLFQLISVIIKNKLSGIHLLKGLEFCHQIKYFLQLVKIF